ncbi:MAG: F0F1 ATP synthase subunit epsilon [Phycisphaeraceae bacterium]|nr:F0F1 ATP synthase subunit epsilon [Phycisphaeraceae bacterium]
MAATFHCSLVTPEKQVLESEAVYASVPTWDGLVGIAPQRAPLLVKLGQGVLRLDLPEGPSRWYFLGGGFAQMKDNQLTLLAEKAVAAEEIDVAAVKASLKTVEDERPHTEAEVALRWQKVMRDRTLLRLSEEAGE